MAHLPITRRITPYKATECSPEAPHPIPSASILGRISIQCWKPQNHHAPTAQPASAASISLTGRHITTLLDASRLRQFYGTLSLHIFAFLRVDARQALKRLHRTGRPTRCSSWFLEGRLRGPRLSNRVTCCHMWTEYLYPPLPPAPGPCLLSPLPTSISQRAPRSSTRYAGTRCGT